MYFCNEYRESYSCVTVWIVNRVISLRKDLEGSYRNLANFRRGRLLTVIHMNHRIRRRRELRLWTEKPRSVRYEIRSMFVAGRSDRDSRLGYQCIRDNGKGTLGRHTQGVALVCATP